MQKERLVQQPPCRVKRGMNAVPALLMKSQRRVVAATAREVTC